MKPTRDSEELLYPMRIVTRMTGLAADTVRAWQRRYGAIGPSRTEGNARRFTATDVRRLQLLRQATEQGHAISDIARRSEAELQALVGRVPAPGAPPVLAADPNEARYREVQHEFLGAIEHYDTRRAADILALGATLFAPRDLVFQLVVPVLQEVGRRWHAGSLSVAHEHLVSNLLEGLLLTLLRLNTRPGGSRPLLVTTPAGHLHAFGALIGALLAATRGFAPVYLGTNTPDADLLAALAATRAEVVLLGISRGVDRAERAALSALAVAVRVHAELWVGLPADHDLHEPLQGCRLFHRFEDLDAALALRAP